MMMMFGIGVMCGLPLGVMMTRVIQIFYCWKPRKEGERN